MRRLLLSTPTSRCYPSISRVPWRFLGRLVQLAMVAFPFRHGFLTLPHHSCCAHLGTIPTKQAEIPLQRCPTRSLASFLSLGSSSTPSTAWAVFGQTGGPPRAVAQRSEL